MPSPTRGGTCRPENVDEGAALQLGKFLESIRDAADERAQEITDGATPTVLEQYALTLTAEYALATGDFTMRSLELLDEVFEHKLATALVQIQEGAFWTAEPGLQTS